MVRLISYKNLKSGIFATILFLLLTINYQLSTVYAQHEGHSVPAAKKTEIPAKKPSGKAVYYCPMHPTYTSDKPGDCPICNMKLVKKEPEKQVAPQEAAGMPKEEAGVYISPEKQQYIGVKTEAVAKRRLIKDISTSGRVAYDPKLYQAQQEYLEAFKVKDQAPALLEASQKKLLLLGMSSKEIEELKKQGKPQENLYLPQDSKTVWVYATIYEYETHLVKEGQTVDVTAVAYPGEIFKGKVISLKPVLDAMTRSLEARIEAEDPEHKLKPEMFVDVNINVDLGEKLAVSEEAVMDTGERKVVFIARPEGRFASRDVRLGHKAGGYYEVLDGLSEGDLIVTSGNFFVDSESRLKAALTGVSHQH